MLHRYHIQYRKYGLRWSCQWSAHVILIICLHQSIDRTVFTAALNTPGRNSIFFFEKLKFLKVARIACLEYCLQNALHAFAKCGRITLLEVCNVLQIRYFICSGVYRNALGPYTRCHSSTQSAPLVAQEHTSIAT